MKQPAPTLIDALYRASFSNRPVMGWRNNSAMRDALVNSRRFVLDDPMSEFLGELASAAFAYAPQLTKVRKRMIEQLRIAARLPHQSVWIEYNLRKCIARSNAILELPYKPEDSPAREGWLIRQHPGIDTAFSLMLFSDSPGEQDEQGNGTWTFPIAYTWTVDDQQPPWPSVFLQGETRDAEVASGLMGYKTDSVTIAQPDLLIDVKRFKPDVIRELVHEWTGTIRRVWALLATLNDIPVLQTDIQQARGFVAKGRYRKFLTHKSIKLNVPEGRQLRKIARQIVAIARRRGHHVRGHYRKDWVHPLSILCGEQHDFQPDGKHLVCQLCKGHKIWIREHIRGDTSQGFTIHDYEVTHEIRPSEDDSPTPIGT